MPRSTPLKRKSFFIDEKALKRAKRLLKVSSDGEAIRISLARVAEMEEFWRFMGDTRGGLESGSFEKP